MLYSIIISLIKSLWRFTDSDVANAASINCPPLPPESWGHSTKLYINSLDLFPSSVIRINRSRCTRGVIYVSFFCSISLHVIRRSPLHNDVVDFCSCFTDYYRYALLEVSLNDFLWIQQIQRITKKFKSGMVTSGITHLETNTLPVLVNAFKAR